MSKAMYQSIGLYASNLTAVIIFTLFLMFHLMSCVEMEWGVLGQLFVFELRVILYFYGSSDWGLCVEQGSRGTKCTRGACESAGLAL